MGEEGLNPGTIERVFSLTRREDYGVNERDANGHKGNGIYFFGIIDILQEYNTAKKAEVRPSEPVTIDHRLSQRMHSDGFEPITIEPVTIEPVTIEPVTIEPVTIAAHAYAYAAAAPPLSPPSPPPPPSHGGVDVVQGLLARHKPHLMRGAGPLREALHRVSHRSH